MYKVLPVEGGWHVFFVEDGKPPRQIDGHPEPYTQRQNAYRRCKRLNDDLEKHIKEIDEMVARDGAIIL